VGSSSAGQASVFINKNDIIYVSDSQSTEQTNPGLGKASGSEP